MTASNPTTLHPVVSPIVEALRTLAHYEPASSEDLGEVLRGLNDGSNPGTVFDHLNEALYSLASWHHESVTGFGLGDAPEDDETDIAFHLHTAANAVPGVRYGPDRPRPPTTAHSERLMKVWILTYGDADDEITETDGVYGPDDLARDEPTKPR